MTREALNKCASRAQPQSYTQPQSSSPFVLPCSLLAHHNRTKLTVITNQYHLKKQISQKMNKTTQSTTVKQTHPILLGKQGENLRATKQCLAKKKKKKKKNQGNPGWNVMTSSKKVICQCWVKIRNNCKGQQQWGLCALRHCIQSSMEAILACHPALSIEWLAGWQIPVYYDVCAQPPS